MKTLTELAKEIQIIAEELKNMKPEIGEMWSVKQGKEILEKHQKMQEISEEVQKIVNMNICNEDDQDNKQFINN